MWTRGAPPYKMIPDAQGRFRVDNEATKGLIIMPIKTAAIVTAILVAAISADPAACESAPEVEAFRKVIRSKNVAEFSTAALALRKYMIANDPGRPIYHFTGPEGWINDPNGVIHHKGAYHLFYQYDPMVPNAKGAYVRSRRCFGHAVSKDLVHWTDWPVALWPDTKYDRGGVYSGNCIIGDDGIPNIFYTGNVRGHGETYGIRARSRDGFLTWEKQMVMDNSQRLNRHSPVHWDAQIWKDGKTWRQLIGGCTDDRKAAAWLWTSPDLTNWKLQKPIYVCKKWRFFELPYLIRFGKKHVLFVGIRGNPYWVGDYDAKSMTFTPDGDDDLKFIDRGDYYSFNPHMTDNKAPDGRRRQLMHGWVTTGWSPCKKVPPWASAHSIPRVITLRNNRIWQEPIPEIELLRGDGKSFSGVKVTGTTRGLIDGAGGDAVEIQAAFTVPKAPATFGVVVRADKKAKGYAVTLHVGGDGKFLWGIADNRSKGPRYRWPIGLKSGEKATLRIFVDRSIIEVYANGFALTAAKCHASGGAGGIALFADTDWAVDKLNVWKMRSMWR